MLLLENAAAGTGPAVQLPAGRWRFLADIAASNNVSVAFQEGPTSAGPWTPIVSELTGSAMTATKDGSVGQTYPSGGNWVRVVTTGGTACSVRANPCPAA